MGRFFDPSLIARTYRDPLAWLSLGVDLLPILAIFMFGWGATPLVALYWLENLVIGAATLARMLVAGFSSLGAKIITPFLAIFFTIHYGMFCFGHGQFLVMMTEDTDGNSAPAHLLDWAFSSGPHMKLFVLAIIVINALYFVVDFIGKGEFRGKQSIDLMFSPYGRIITLHVAIIIGAAVALNSDEPLLGVLGLLMLRFAFGIGLSTYRRLRLDKRNLKVDA